MGNRAVIQIQGQETGVYLHWNGGYDTVKPLLDVAREYGVRADDYGTARLAQMLGNFFGGILNVGVGSIDRLDCNNGDNGTYVVDANFNIVDRLFYKGREANYHDYNEKRNGIKQANDRYFIKQEDS